MKKNNRLLYNKIMNNISYSIRHILSENIEHFDITDYQDNDEDLISHENITNKVIKKPKSIEEEKSFFEKLEPSTESLNIAKSFTKKIENILNPLRDKKNLKKVLPYLVKKLQGDEFYLIIDFTVLSNFCQGVVAKQNKYVNHPYIQFEQDQLDPKKFIIISGIKDLAKMIEFCDLYKNPLNATIYIGSGLLYNDFRSAIKTKDAITDPLCIWPLGGPYLPPYTNTTETLFEHILSIYEEFIEFIFKGIKNNRR